MLFAHIKKLVHSTITSANGLVSFKSNVEMPLKVTCEFSPVQEGTGDPSPDNVRPISGWTGCEIEQSGSNIFNAQADIAIPVKPSGHRYYHASPNSYILGIHYTSFNYYGPSYITDFTKTQTGFTYSTTNASYTVGYLVKVHEGQIFGAFANMINSGMTVGFYTDDFDMIKLENSANNRVLTVPASSKYAFVRFNASKTNTLIEVSDIVIWRGEKPDSYVAYEPLKSIPITFTDPSTGDPLTVYGGTVMLNEDGSADLTQTHRYFVVEPSSASLNADKDGGVWAQISLPSNYYASPSTRDLYSNIFTNSGYTKIYGASASATGNRIIVGLPAEYNTTVLIRQFFTDNQTQFAYLLATPVTYHFDNIGQLQSFLGTNNIWHNMNGSITAEYYKKQ